MLSPVLYMTSLRVASEQEELWNEFYDGWVRDFTREVPGTIRGSKWQVYEGRVGSVELVPDAAWPMYLAVQEYCRVDELVVSRFWRRNDYWAPRVRSFDPWFKHLTDYATLNLQDIAPPRSIASGPREIPGELASHLLCRFWSVPPDRLEEFEQWRLQTVAPMIRERSCVMSEHRYVALLAQLHRHGGAEGELVVPHTFRIEEEGRLCYVDLYELSEDPVAPALLDDLQEASDSWGGVLADRQDVLARRVLLVERDGS